jgi:3-hydroxyacyl-[acyl-carrier-protein] dehydratase
MKLLNDLYSIISRTCGEGRCDFTIELNPQHFIYKAHFPGLPITPGVCLVQIGLEVASDYLERTMEIDRVNNVKFLSVLSPQDVHGNVVYELMKVTEEEPNRQKVQMCVYDEQVTYAKISMTLKPV